jgi:hypothetical protein
VISYLLVKLGDSVLSTILKASHLSLLSAKERMKGYVTFPSNKLMTAIREDIDLLGKGSQKASWQHKKGESRVTPER